MSTPWTYHWVGQCKFEALSHVGAWVNKVLGLLLTLFLIAFGAPFWNDVLNTLIGMKKTLGNP